jgi:hypothetical protein
VPAGAELARAAKQAGDARSIPGNLGVQCRHCHGYKHSKGVSVIQPTPGTFVWRTRLGHTYTTGPPPPT